MDHPLSSRWLPILAVITCAAMMLVCPTISHAAQLPVLNWTERSDWVNVKTDVVPAAVGDGVADDTAAIQAALNTTGNGRTIYFPPGTYKVTSTLSLSGGNSHYAMTLIGHGRNTTLNWAGTASNFISINGNPYTRYVGLKLNGNNTAVDGFYVRNTLKFETNIRFQHMGFYNFTGKAVDSVTGDSYAMAETSYENCIFDHCNTGVYLGGTNDYDHTLTGCDFISCAYGVYCNHGNFYARDCYFYHSTTCDMYSLPEHGCSVRRCKSVGSAQFIYNYNGVSTYHVEDCYVDGWTGANGAIQHGYRPPLVVSNCRFVNPPDTAAPVRASFWDTRAVIACNNAAPGSTSVFSVSPGTLYTVPNGAISPRVGSTNGQYITSFIKETVTVPPTVYDAKTGYGAVGDGTADDTTAIQNCINAARTAGGGAIAYIPLGTYKITSALSVTGSNYVIGGSGYFSRLKWGGTAGGTIMTVSDPSNVTIEHLMVGHADIGTQTNAIDIEQTSTGAASTMTYDGVYVWGKYQNQPENKGLRLNGLGSSCMVNLKWVQGNLRLYNSANATVVAGITYEGGITVDHTSATRNGFLGFMTRLSTQIPNNYAMTIRNSNSIVMSDYYNEQGYMGTSLLGAEGDPAGRITLSCPKTDFSNASAQVFTINNYNGKIFYGPTQFYTSPAVHTITQTGANAVNLVMSGCLFYNCSLNYSGESSALFNFVGNGGAGTGVAPANNYDATTLTNMALAVDDLQKLGNLDLDWNQPQTVFPDLIVTDVSWTPANPNAGDPVTFSATIQNQGMAPTPDGTVVGIRFTVNGVAVTWSDDNSTALLPGASRTQTANGPSWTAVAGSNSVEAWVNDTIAGVHRFQETDFDNNKRTESCVVNAKPTVSITSPANGAVIIGNSVTIDATAADSDGTITKVEFFQNGNKIGEDTVSPYSINWTSVTGNPYTLTAVATDNNLATTTSAAVNITVYNTQDIGTVGVAGSASYAGTTFTVAGAGAGITGTADAFRSVFRQITGDCTITARVATFSSTQANARAGVMMRQNLNANSIEASTLFKPSSTIGVWFHRRTSAGGSTSTSSGTATAAPYWVRLVRTGNTLKAYRSANGTSWTQVGSNTTVTMTNPIYIGFAVTSGTTGSTATATFDNVTITQP